MITQQEFYELPEVQKQLDIQKQNRYGSEAHKNAYRTIGVIAEKYGVLEQYKQSGGTEY